MAERHLIKEFNGINRIVVNSENNGHSVGGLNKSLENCFYTLWKSIWCLPFRKFSAIAGLSNGYEIRSFWFIGLDFYVFLLSLFLVVIDF